MARKKKNKKKISKTRQLYLKERKRISSIVSKLRKKGYDVTLSDIAGEIPQRVTKKRLEELKKIRSQKQILTTRQLTKKPVPAPLPQPAEPTWEDLILENFKDQMQGYHPEVRSAINKWLNYILDNFGIEELAAALDAAEYENIYLSSYGGYLVNPEDLSLYLHQLTHFVMGSETTPDLQDIANEVEQIISQYEIELAEYEAAEFGNWNRGKRPRWAG